MSTVIRKLDTTFINPGSKPVYINPHDLHDPWRRYVAVNTVEADGEKVLAVPNLHPAPGEMYSSTASAPIKRITPTATYLEFDGINQVMLNRNSDATAIGTAGYTVYAVAQIPAGATTRGIISAGAGSNGTLSINADRKLQAWRSSLLLSNLTVDDGWHLFVGVYNGASSRLLMDGVWFDGTLGTQAPGIMEVGRANTTFSRINIAEWGSYAYAMNSAEQTWLRNMMATMYPIT